jgi:hypothetical protein
MLRSQYRRELGRIQPVVAAALEADGLARDGQVGWRGIVVADGPPQVAKGVAQAGPSGGFRVFAPEKASQRLAAVRSLRPENWGK